MISSISITVNEWVIFIPIVIILLFLIFGSGKDGLDFTPILWIFALIIFIVLWGGIFWW